MTVNAFIPTVFILMITSRFGAAVDINYDIYCNGRGHINTTAQYEARAVTELVMNMCICDPGWSSLTFLNYSASYCVVWTKRVYASKFDDIYNCVPYTSVESEPFFPPGDWVCFDKHPKYDLLPPHGPSLTYQFKPPSWCSTRFSIRSQNCHCGRADSRPLAEICREDGRVNIYPIFAENAPPTAALPGSQQSKSLKYEPYCNGRGRVNRTAQDVETNVDYMVANLCTCDPGWSSMLFSNFSVRYCSVWTKPTYEARLESVYDWVPVSSVEHESYFQTGYWLCYDKHPRYTLRQPHGPELLFLYKSPSWCRGRWRTRTQSCDCSGKEKGGFPEICLESDRDHIVPTYTVNEVPQPPSTVYEPYCNGRGVFNETAQLYENANDMVLNLCTCDSGWTSLLFKNLTISYCVVWKDVIYDSRFDDVYDCVPTSTIAYDKFFPAGRWACYDKYPKYTLAAPQGPQLLFHFLPPKWCKGRWRVRTQICNCDKTMDKPLPEVCQADEREMISPVFVAHARPESAISTSAPPSLGFDTNFDLYCNGRGHIDETTLLKESDSETMIQNLCVCDEGWTSMFFRNYSASYCTVWKEAEYDTKFNEIYNCVPSSTIPMELMFPAGEWVCPDKYPKYELLKPHGPVSLFYFAPPAWCTTRWMPRAQACRCGDDQNEGLTDACSATSEDYISPVFVKRPPPPVITTKLTTTSTTTTTTTTTVTTRTTTTTLKSTVAVVISPEVSGTTVVRLGVATSTATTLIVSTVADTSSPMPTFTPTTFTVTTPTTVRFTTETATTVSEHSTSNAAYSATSRSVSETVTLAASVSSAYSSRSTTGGARMGNTSVGLMSSTVGSVLNESTMRQVGSTSTPSRSAGDEVDAQGSTPSPLNSSECGEHGSWSTETGECVCDDGWGPDPSEEGTSEPCGHLGFAGDGGNRDAAPASNGDNSGGGSWIVVALLAVFVLVVGIILMVRLCRSRCVKGRNDRLMWLWEVKKAIKKRLPRTRPPRGFSDRPTESPELRDL